MRSCHQKWSQTPICRCWILCNFPEFRKRLNVPECNLWPQKCSSWKPWSHESIIECYSTVRWPKRLVHEKRFYKRRRSAWNIIDQMQMWLIQTTQIGIAILLFEDLLQDDSTCASLRHNIETTSVIWNMGQYACPLYFPQQTDIATGALEYMNPWSIFCLLSASMLS